jgi:hypothetical protein
MDKTKFTLGTFSFPVFLQPTVQYDQQKTNKERLWTIKLLKTCGISSTIPTPTMKKGFVETPTINKQKINSPKCQN